MRVRLKQNWFSPTQSHQIDKLRRVSGKRYRKGVREMPDELKPFLPSSAEILEGPVEEDVKEDEPDTLRAYDQARTAALTTAKVMEEADEERKKVGRPKKENG